MWDCCEGLNIVDDGGPSEEAFNCRERGLQTWPASLAFDCFEQGRLFAANVGASAAVQVTFDGEVGLPAEQPLRAEDPCFIGFADRLFHDPGLVPILAANKEVRGIEFARPACDGDSFDDLMWVVVNEEPVLEGSRLSLITVNREVPPAAVDFGQEPPLDAAREPGTASTAELRVLDALNDIGGLHRDGLAKRLVSAGAAVLLHRDQCSFGRVAPRPGRNAFGQNRLIQKHLRGSSGPARRAVRSRRWWSAEA